MAIQTQMDDLVFFAGDDWPFIPFAVVTPVSDADGNVISFDPVDITGDTISFALFLDPERQTTAIFTLSAPTEITITNAAGGLGYFSVFKNKTTLLQGGPGGLPIKYYAQIIRTTSGGLVRTIGLITIPVRQ